jgi:enoyl-CoA hydratase/3-hydroxyacyl-CoA dehydrogenase
MKPDITEQLPKQTPGKIDEINKVVFIGAGTMGCFNALFAGISGYEAILFDISDEMLQWAGYRLDKIGEFLAEKNLFTNAQIGAGRNHIHLESDPGKAVENADLLSESVPETLELKRSVHQQFDGLCPSHTILTTNTSNLLVSKIEDAVERGDRFAAMHFHLGSLFVDLVKGPRTSTKTMDILNRFVKSMTCIPHVHKKESAGYVYNAIMMGQSTACWSMAVDHKQRIEDLDRAWMIFNKEKIGPFGIMDFLGLDLYFDGNKGLLEDPERRELAQRTLDFLQTFMDKGELGIKTEKGFYTYS